MTGTLAQLIALTSYGNHFLRKGELEPEFYPGNSTFQFCDHVDFREMSKLFFFSKYSEKIICQDPIEWFNFLKKEKTKKLHLFYRPSEDLKMGKDYKLAGFVGGGGTWMIEQRCQNYSYYWQARWTFNSEEKEKAKKWTVNYARFSRKILSTNADQSLERLREEFRKALSEIASFAAAQNLHGWANTFQKALYELTNLTPGEAYYHKDLVPKSDFTINNLQLLFSAAMAWVFGGMGSWNDLTFDDPEAGQRYDELSERLYTCLNAVLVGVINS